HLANQHEVVQAAGLLRVGEGAVDLGLVAGRIAGRELGAEILPAVALVADLGLDAIVEVLVVVALAEQVAGLLAAGDEDAFLDAPLAGVLGMRLPAVQVLAVEELHPAGVVLAAGVGGKLDQGSRAGAHKQGRREKQSSHGVSPKVSAKPM